jgi:hypothetical protein
MEGELCGVRGLRWWAQYRVFLKGPRAVYDSRLVYRVCIREEKEEKKEFSTRPYARSWGVYEKEKSPRLGAKGATRAAVDGHTRDGGQAGMIEAWGRRPVTQS